MIKKFIAAIGLLVFTGFNVQAQNNNLKIGHVNVGYILGNMPESQEVQSDLNAFRQQLGIQLQNKTDTLQQDIQEFEQTASSMTSEVRNQKGQELRQRNQQLQQERQQAQVKIQQKRAELLQPVYNKIQNHINQVVEENNFTYIIRNDSQLPTLLHAPEENDISNLVLMSMGVTPPESGPPEESATGTDG